MPVDESSTSSSWSREQEKAFENALATHLGDTLDSWEKIVADVPGKTLEEIQSHYEILVDDINRIESGCVPLPSYYSSSEGSYGGEDGIIKKGNHNGRSDKERRKGIAWSENEHRLFLLGLDKHGKGDWRSISRNFVVTRTPTQVASHAQKYFNRLNSNSNNKDRRRSSIHDITSIGDNDISAPHGPIIGQTNGSQLVSSTVKSTKQSLQPAVGTPVNLPGHVPAHILWS